MTNEMQALFDEIQRRGLTVAKFATQAGIPADRVYQWQRSRGKPKAEDAAKIETWLGGSPGQLSRIAVELRAATALLAVLLDEMAAMKAAATGGSVSAIKRTMQQAAEQLAALG